MCLHCRGRRVLMIFCSDKRNKDDENANARVSLILRLKLTHIPCHPQCRTSIALAARLAHELCIPQSNDAPSTYGSARTPLAAPTCNPMHSAKTRTTRCETAGQHVRPSTASPSTSTRTPALCFTAYLTSGLADCLLYRQLLYGQSLCRTFLGSMVAAARSVDRTSSGVAHSIRLAPVHSSPNSSYGSCTGSSHAARIHPPSLCNPPGARQNRLPSNGQPFVMVSRSRSVPPSLAQDGSVSHKTHRLQVEAFSHRRSNHPLCHERRACNPRRPDTPPSNTQRNGDKTARIVRSTYRHVCTLLRDDTWRSRRSTTPASTRS